MQFFCPNVHWQIYRYLYYFENGNPIIHVRYITGLIALINEQNATGEGGSAAMSSAVEAHYKNTLGEFEFGFCSIKKISRIFGYCAK